jgi:sterol desaturase/sphingolipid hydroxylase (fatty acid hydroxylase superfamily)
MEALLQYFGQLEKHPLQRMAFLVGGLLFFWILEGAIPLFRLRYKKTKLKHALVNVSFTVMHLIIHTGLAIVIVLIGDWCFTHQFGLVYWLNAGTLAGILISFLVLDFFGGWLVHITEHKVPLLWRFHVIHHADNSVDVTTGLRHHPGESILRGLFFFMGIAVSGAPMYAVMIFQTILILATAFTHANIQLPKSVDALLSWVLVSPNMHKVHHHYMLPYTDSNFGNIFSIWDRLFGTFMYMPSDEIVYGIDTYFDDQQTNSIGELWKIPFSRDFRFKKPTT